MPEESKTRPEWNAPSSKRTAQTTAIDGEVPELSPAQQGELRRASARLRGLRSAVCGRAGGAGVAALARGGRASGSSGAQHSGGDQRSGEYARQAAAGGRTTPFGERLRERWDSFFTPVTAFVRQPRFVMSFGMIFFSFSLGLSAMGVKATDVAKVDLRPSALRHAYNGAQIKVVKYYDNIRFVYEIESKLRELKRTNTPAEPGPQQQKENRKNNTSGQPEQRQDRNYSQDYNQPVLAALRDGDSSTPVLRDGPGEAPPVTATTNRRFV